MTTAFLFPGQGAQFVGMGLDHLRLQPGMAQLFEQASELVGLDVLRAMTRGPRHALVRTDIAQVAIFTLSIALANCLSAHGLRPTTVAGHSLGQFSALVASGALTFEEGLALVVERGRLMHEANQRSEGTMLAISGLTTQQVEECVAGIGSAWVAKVNACDQVIVSGLGSALRQVHTLVVQASGKAVWLDVAGAYHSPLLREASQCFSAAIERAPLRDADIPLIGNSDAHLLQQAHALRAELHRHMLLPVQWAKTMARLRDMPLRLLVEVGPGKVLRGLALRNGVGLPCLGTGTARELQQTLLTLEGHECAS